MDDRSLDRLTRFRRDLHRIPELDRDLPKTVEYVKNALSELRCTVFFPAQSAVCAYFDCGKEDTVAFRTDMDALPVTETSDCDFASAHPGCMHACGHDGHMALVLELAHSVDRLAPDLPHNVLLIFQPAEETTGGARYICESGVFERYRVSHIFGTHLWPALPAGEVVTRSGPMLAKSSEVNVTVTGKSAHGATPHLGLDPLNCAAQILVASSSIISRRINSRDAAVITPCQIHGGSTWNRIPDDCFMEGSTRFFDEEVGRTLHELLDQTAAGIASSCGCTAKMSWRNLTLPVVNDPKLVELARSAAKSAGIDLIAGQPWMASETYARFRAIAPVVMAFVGCANDQTGCGAPQHSDKFEADERCLSVSAALTVEFARRFLA